MEGRGGRIMDTYKISLHKLTSNSLARNSVIVLVGSMGANVLSYLYHLVMGRLLGPSGYGELSSLLSILYIFTVPLLVAQTVLVKFVSGFKAHGEIGQAKSLFVQATKSFIVVSVLGLPLILISAPWVTAFLHLPSIQLYVLVYVLLVFSLLTVATVGVLTGYQKFLWVSGIGALAILVKLLLSIPLVVWGVSGVLAAGVAASVIIYGIYFIPLRFVLTVKSKATQLTKRDALGFAVPTLLTQLGVISLFSTDIILVRHYMNAHDAGIYAALAILGKIIFYASSAVPSVLFPVASERSARGTNIRTLVTSATLAVAAVSGGLTLVYFLFPSFIIGLLFGSAYSGAALLLGQFAVFLAFYSVGNILAISSLAAGKMNIWVISVLAAMIQIIGMTLFHATLSSVVYLNIGVAAFFAIGSAGYYFYEKI